MDSAGRGYAVPGSVCEGHGGVTCAIFYLRLRDRVWSGVFALVFGVCAFSQAQAPFMWRQWAAPGNGLAPCFSVNAHDAGGKPAVSVLAIPARVVVLALAGVPCASASVVQFYAAARGRVERGCADRGDPVFSRRERHRG